jgi:ABC-type lipoprotein export system ATPase subunit
MNLALKCSKVGLLYPHFSSQSNQHTRLSGVYCEQLEIPVGRITAIVGRSGSGKSTLLNILASLKQSNSVRKEGDSELSLWPDSIDHLDLLHGDQPIPGDIGFVFQEPHLLKPLPTLSNYSAGAVITGRSIGKAEFREFAIKCDLVRETGNLTTAGETKDIERIMSLPVGSLSGGQAQRISVGRALAADPRLLVCDEATSSLDGETGRVVMSMIREWLHEGKGNRSVIWVTHDLEQAAEFADGFVVTSHGRVIADVGGRPFPVIAGDVVDARADIDATIQAHEMDNPITSAKLDKQGIAIDGIPAIYNRKNKGRQLRAHKRGKRGKAASFAVFTCLFNCVRFEMFGNRSDSAGKSGKFSLWGLLTRFSKWGMMLSFILGLVVLYTSLLGKSVFEKYFDARLNEPKVSHFVVTGSRGTRHSETLFSTLGVQKLQNELVSTYSTPPQEGVRAPEVFGRRQITLAEVVQAIDGECPTAEQAGLVREGVRSVLTVDTREPLFAKLFEAAKQKSAASHGSGDRTAIVTTAFSQWLSAKNSQEAATGFCLPRLGNDAYFRIADVVQALPGAGKYAYDVAIEDDDYLDLYELNPPASAVDASGRTTYPSYSNAAVYFDKEYAEKIICEFFDEQKAKQSNLCAGAQKRQGYITNSDVLGQLTGLISIASTTNYIIMTVVILYIILIAVSISFTLNAFIWKNEKFLSVLKAFRYNFRHLFFLGLLQAILVLIIAVLFAFVIVIAIGPVVQTMAGGLHFPASWLDFQMLTFLTSFAILGGLSVVVVAVVLSIWWRNNRYVGDKLQSI